METGLYYLAPEFILAVTLVLTLVGQQLVPATMARHERWLAVFRSGDIPLLAKLGLALLGVSVVAAAVVAVARNLEVRARWLVAIAIVAFSAWAFLFIAPLRWATGLLFFLRDFRNPDWFQLAISSFALVYPAALVVDAVQRRLGGRRLLRGCATAADV